MEKVRVGIVGMGVMGNNHARRISGCKEVAFTAVADVDPQAAKAAAEAYDVPAFGSHTEMIESGLVDVVLIATPHYDHPVIAIEAMQAGMHVYVEKPMAVRLSSADAMIKTANETGMLMQVGFNSRATSLVQVARQIVEEGRLGEIYRAEMIDSGFRSQAYYDSATWRATWKGEGGGVLMNQSPHGLDRFAMLVGLPSRVEARVMTRRHRIEVEDEASAILEYANGATAYIHCSVNEAPGGNRLEILGEKGKLEITRGIRLWEVPDGVQTYSDTTEKMFGPPEVKEVEVEIPEMPNYAYESHADLLGNLARAILHGEPLLCPGEQGLAGLELADAILMSGNTGKPVDVPVNREAFDAWLNEMRGE